jgi:hypothetical protein
MAISKSYIWTEDKMDIDKTQTGLAGEYYVLAQLTARGYIATLTLGNTKGVDIIVTNQGINKFFKVEVKTTINKPKNAKHFTDKKAYHWTMGKKHETIIDENLIYCFVMIEDVNKLPLFFLVPSKEVAVYVKWQHNHWLSTINKQFNETNMRQFRIVVDDPENYRDNWKIFN